MNLKKNNNNNDIEQYNLSCRLKLEVEKFWHWEFVQTN